jgi:alpha-ketoglutarate-dependent 2,4-dichlorophenoxyacetate dioxygenase
MNILNQTTESSMRLTPLHPLFGVEIHDVDLRTVDRLSGYPDIRAAFEAHSLLLFRGQHLENAAHLRLGALFGPIEDHDDQAMGRERPKTRVDNLSNRLEGGAISAPDSAHTLDLKANQLWHTDSTFLPVPALANILAARVLSSTGGETELASTRVALRELPEALRARARASVFRHRLTYSRAKIAPELATAEIFTRWREQRWKAVWRNPINGEEALYIASHVCAVDGLDEETGQAFVDELMDFVTRPGRIYTHSWQPGDVLIWDERATVHRARPWPYAEERTLAGICISARDVDGLEDVRPI